LGGGVVPPNNQGIATPKYNQGDNGENVAKDGVATAENLDPYTAQGIARLSRGYRAFAASVTMASTATSRAFSTCCNSAALAKDAQGGYNVHTIALNIPLSGHRRATCKPSAFMPPAIAAHRPSCARTSEAKTSAKWVQVSRQGNPLFCEAFVAIADKDRYSRTSPTVDAALFRKYAETPELARLINPHRVRRQRTRAGNQSYRHRRHFHSRSHQSGSLDRSVRLAGGGASHATNPDDAGFSRLGIFGGDTLTSQIQTGFGGGTLPAAGPTAGASATTWWTSA